MMSPVSATHTRTTRGLDQVIDIETPEQVVFSYTVAGIGSRSAAALIDHLIIIGSLILLALFYLFVIVPVLHVPSGATLFSQRAGGWALAILLLLQFVAQWGYYVLFEGLWDGQTPGKRWLRLRVVQDGGYSISFAPSAARNIARIIDMQPGIFYLVGLTAVAVSKTGKRAGDQLAGTIVVREHILPLTAPAVPEPKRAAAITAATAALSDEELELLQRFLSRVDTLDGARMTTLAAQLAARFKAHLPADTEQLAALRILAEREREARTHGVSARGDTGAAREQYALVAEGSARWSRFAHSLTDVQRRGLQHMSGEEVARFVAEYREIATDLARLSTAARGHDLDAIFRLSRLVAGGHNLIYRRERMAGRAIARYLFTTVPAELRRSVAPILAAALLLFGSGVATYLGVVRDPALVEELVSPAMIDRAEVDAARARRGDRRYIDVEDYARPVIASSVLRNNVQVAFLAFASGLTAGVFTVLLLFFNGVSIGAVFGLFQTRDVLQLILDFVVAHSVFELTAICIAGGAGFVIARAILLPAARTRREALVQQGQRALRLLTAAAFFLLFAGAIEGLISPRVDLSFAFKSGVALVSALLVGVYVTLG
ncbi:MAG: stage II sporulation protein M, partial [Longimicrobiales bacterium]